MECLVLLRDVEITTLFFASPAARVSNALLPHVHSCRVNSPSLNAVSIILHE